MKTLIMVIISSMIATAAQAEIIKPSLNQCREAVNAMSFIYANDSVCGGHSSLDYQMGVLELCGCTSKVSLNDIRLAISRDLENLRQLKYKSTDMYFCTSKDIGDAYRDAHSSFLNNTALR